MLILTRRIDESLMIGDDIEVVVLGIQGNQVRLGVKAPGDMLILREELLNNPDLHENLDSRDSA